MGNVGVNRFIPKFVYNHNGAFYRQQIREKPCKI